MQGWWVGESTRFPPMWRGIDSRTRRHMCVEFVVGSLLCLRGFQWTNSHFVEVPLKFPFDFIFFKNRPEIAFCFWVFACWSCEINSHRDSLEVEEVLNMAWQVLYFQNKYYIWRDKFYIFKHVLYMAWQVLYFVGSFMYKLRCFI